MDKSSKYSAEWVSAYFDAYGEQEWDRFSHSAVDQVSLYVHTHYIERYVKPASRVLEVGAGPGRFTQVLARLDCRVVVADISQVQLDLHRKHAAESGFDAAVEDRVCLDVCDMNTLPSESFDAVVCYGGPLSYVFDMAGKALSECVRVCRKGGRILASVMSLWGACHRYLDGVLQVPPEDNRKITDTGDLTPENWKAATHLCHMFRSNELREMAGRAGMGVVVMSASNCLSTRWDERLSTLKDDPASWDELLRMELEACRQEGCLDMGTHIILVGEKT